MAYNNQQGYQQGQTDDIALGWDDTINGDDANGYEPLPEGDYYFTVKNFTRGRYEGSEKLPPCNKAVLTLALTSAWTPTQEKPAAAGETTANLLIVKSLRWKLSQFFIAIGYLKPGEEKAMNWNIVPGSTGTCTVSIREWTGNDGKKHKGNEVTRFYDPEKFSVPPASPAAPAAAPRQTWQPAAAAPAVSAAPAAAGNQGVQQQMAFPQQPANPWAAGKF
ncbi:MAG: hypothetical protein IJT94_16250 [Oscillibacter sp.]|nr:hypothetical protein [Oscillibacter sp.]